MNPLTNTIYVANRGASTISVINGSTNAATTVTDPSAVSPVAVSLNPVTNKIYVANMGASPNFIGNRHQRPMARRKQHLYEHRRGNDEPLAVSLNPVTNKIYVANNGSSSLTVIDGPSNGTITIGTGATPIAVAVDPLTNKIFVANGGPGTIRGQL